MLIEKTNDEFLVQFMEAGTDDETWAQEHIGLLKTIFEWATREYRASRLQFHLVQRLAICVQKHREIILPILYMDLEIFVKDYTTKGNSLLYSSQSSNFRDLIQTAESPKNVLPLEFFDVPSDIFKLVEEYVNTGDVEHLWRYPQQFLRRVLMRSGQWHIRGLIQLVADVMRRYIDRDNAIEILWLAQNYVLPELKQACCEALNHMALGAQFESLGEADLAVTIYEFRDRTVPLLNEVATIISHLYLCEHSAETLEIRHLLARCNRLRVLVMRGSKGCDFDIISLIPNIRELDLSACPWLTDKVAAQILGRLPNLSILSLAENGQLGYEAFRPIAATLKQLQILSCMYCAGFQDGFITMIARSCPSLSEINISWCPRITDVGLQALGSLAHEISVIDITHCIKVTDAGVRDLVRPLLNLEKLIMQHLPLVSEDGIYNIVALCPTLKVLDIRLCTVTEAGIAKIHKRNPNLQLLY